MSDHPESPAWSPESLRTVTVETPTALYGLLRPATEDDGPDPSPDDLLVGWVTDLEPTGPTILTGPGSGLHPIRCDSMDSVANRWAPMFGVELVRVNQRTG